VNHVIILMLFIGKPG